MKVKVDLYGMADYFEVKPKVIIQILKEYKEQYNELPTVEELERRIVLYKNFYLKENLTAVIAGLSRIGSVLARVGGAIVNFLKTPAGRFLLRTVILHYSKEVFSSKDETDLKNNVQKALNTLFGSRAKNILDNLEALKLDSGLSNNINLELPAFNQLQNSLKNNDLFKEVVINDDSVKRYLILKSLLTGVPLDRLEQQEAREIANGLRRSISNSNPTEQKSQEANKENEKVSLL
jgi:hypothetical protein